MPVQKTCEKCGKVFECCADSRGCWCEQFSLATETLRYLKNAYHDCLCSSCIAAFASAQSENAQSANSG